MKFYERINELSDAMGIPINEFDVLLIDNPTTFDIIVFSLMFLLFILVILDLSLE